MQVLGAETVAVSAARFLLFRGAWFMEREQVQSLVVGSALENTPLPNDQNQNFLQWLLVSVPMQQGKGVVVLADRPTQRTVAKHHPWRGVCQRMACLEATLGRVTLDWRLFQHDVHGVEQALDEVLAKWGRHQ